MLPHPVRTLFLSCSSFARETEVPEELLWRDRSRGGGRVPLARRAAGKFKGPPRSRHVVHWVDLLRSYRAEKHGPRLNRGPVCCFATRKSCTRDPRALHLLWNHAVPFSFSWCFFSVRRLRQELLWSTDSSVVRNGWIVTFQTTAAVPAPRSRRSRRVFQRRLRTAPPPQNPRTCSAPTSEQLQFHRVPRTSWFTPPTPMVRWPHPSRCPFMICSLGAQRKSLENILHREIKRILV